jgi:hypothetical protein
MVGGRVGTVRTPADLIVPSVPHVAACLAGYLDAWDAIDFMMVRIVAWMLSPAGSQAGQIGAFLMRKRGARHQ